MSKRMAVSTRETCLYCGEDFTKVITDFNRVENKDSNFCSENCRTNYPNKMRYEDRQR